MPRRRRSDGTKTPDAASLTTSSPMLIRPVVFCSRPASMRNVVVLPQPDGPSSVRNSPSLTRRSTSLTAAKSPNFRLTFSRMTLDIRFWLQSQGAGPYPLLHDAELHPSEDDHHGHHDEADHAHLFGAAVRPKLQEHDR